MAAIIAQLAAANRKRKARAKLPTLAPEKSNRVLPPFDRCFDARKHNRYLKLKAILEHREEVMATARGTFYRSFFTLIRRSVDAQLTLRLRSFDTSLIFC